MLIYIDIPLPIFQKGPDYRNGDIRLVGGSYSWEGRVEIYLGGEWGTISYGNTDSLDAFVVCRQLGYDTRCKLDFPLLFTLIRKGFSVLKLIVFKVYLYN